ncbi:MAG: mannosyltransferase family protein [Chloroflexota bacterium]|nr:mannosyltransferase family protein [Chloroflexota bacterium]
MTEVLRIDRTTAPVAAGWRAALTWGLGAALVHRVLLTVWMAAIWALVSSSGGVPPSQMDFHNTADLPTLSPLESQLFGFWRRWDAVHYLDLALNGYRIDNLGATVFSPLASWAFRAADLALPSGIDLAAGVVQTLAFGVALTLLQRFVTTYYNDAELARWTVGVCVLLPLSFYFAAPISESLYLALTMATLYAASRIDGVNRWVGWLAALCGIFASLARSQGALLAGVAALLVFERVWDGRWTRASLIAAARTAFGRGWMLALIPLGAVAFQVYRATLGLPSMDFIYTNYSYAAIVDPFTGLIGSLRYLVAAFPAWWSNVDVWAMILSLIGIGIALRLPRHRRAPLIAYNVVFWLFFFTKLNYQWGTTDPYFAQSFGRYTLVLFPLTALIADGLRSGGFWVRIGGVAVLLLALAGLAALFPLALVGP